MRLRRLAVALAACCLQVCPAAADESINIFVAIDAAYYLGLVLCGMVRAYGEPSSAARRGRPFKFFVLHGPRLPATTVCAASEAALRCRAARSLNPKFGTDRDLARVETRRWTSRRPRAPDWSGCAQFEHTDDPRGSCVGTAAATRHTRTVNTIALAGARVPKLAPSTRDPRPFASIRAQLQSTVATT